MVLDEPITISYGVINAGTPLRIKIVDGSISQPGFSRSYDCLGAIGNLKFVEYIRDVIAHGAWMNRENTTA